MKKIYGREPGCFSTLFALRLTAHGELVGGCKLHTPVSLVTIVPGVGHDPGVAGVR
jgi:hypothetical protein